jgi:hypothetical protein
MELNESKQLLLPRTSCNIILVSTTKVIRSNALSVFQTSLAFNFKERIELVTDREVQADERLGATQPGVHVSSFLTCRWGSCGSAIDGSPADHTVPPQ